MQVFSTDLYARKLLCTSGQAAVSVFFKIDAAAVANPFFAWQADPTTIPIDLSLILTKTAGTTMNISGYSGTDTMPNCTSGICWYLIN
jgi:hypothetical protein